MLAAIPFALLLASVIEAAPTPGPSTLTSYHGWNSAGCYVDSVDARVLPVTMDTAGGPAAMTVELCLDACHNAGYDVAGLEWSQECYCGTALPTQQATDGRCNMVCNGNGLEYCGGGNGLNVYTHPPATGPTNVQSYNSWSYANCYVDQLSPRALPVTMEVPGGTAAMTVELCLDACRSAGYSIAGVEWSQECYCGNEMPSQIATDGRCDMECNGDHSELCGGGWGLSVYEYGQLPTYKSWTFSNCYVDSIWDRVLPETMYVAGSMTIESCLDACDAAGYEFAGVEYGQECYCGRSLPPTVADDGRCDMPCQGNGAEICGGGNGIDVYQSSNPSNTHGHHHGHDGWSFEGCFVDSIWNRVLPVRSSTNQDSQMTIGTCLDMCGDLGYSYAGLEYAHECWCGSSLPSDRANDGRCNMACTGNSHELCGGGNGIDVYHHGTFSTSIATTLTTTTCSTATITTATTVVEPVTGTTTYGEPLTITTTFIAPATITTTYGAPLTLTTTIPVAATGSTTVPDVLTLTTTVAALVTGTSTIPGPFTYTTTIPVLAPGTTITSVPVLELTTRAVPIPTTSLSSTTFAYPSATLSIFTGTTSFKDSFTTIFEPVIILTTLVKTITTTSIHPVTFTTTSFDIEPFTSYSPSLEPFTTTSYDIEPVTTTTFDFEPFTSTSFDIEPFTTTSSDIDVFTTTTYDIEPFTSTTSVTEIYPGSTTVVTDFTTTSYSVGPYTTTGFDAETTTVTTVVPAPITVTTTIVTAVHPTSTWAPI